MDALDALRRYWGYERFWPLQERIVSSLLGGRDVCVVMPTGGGKSLCYQLPAALQSSRTVIVISPLIALMQDQMAQLGRMGIAAAMLNSALSEAEQTAAIQKALGGEYRLLYLSPERLMREDTIGWLKRVPVAFFAIDEAHCISEWGHEFRPEYRQLSSLRVHFPERPIAAFTASATRQVRHDIVEQLRLRDPDKYIASFYRRNLRYIVKECEGGTQSELLLAALRKHSGENAIVYAPTIARVGETVNFLKSQGIAAVGYHAKMDSETRRKNQERWTSDEIRVLVGTIAFGLGINKAAVRAVIHLSLPKSIEQYYQEAGRAGRDGAPADCILLWQRRDVGLLTYFVEQIEDAEERVRAWRRYREVLGFVNDRKCRHRQICLHFGEAPKWKACQGCDVCSGTPEWLHLGEGATRPKARKRRSSGYVAETELRGCHRIAPARQVVGGDPNGAALTGVNPELREYLREWRRGTAREHGIAAFIVLHDSVLNEICRRKPASIAELRAISGFGTRKAELYGDKILHALRRFKEGEHVTRTPEKIE